MTRFVPQVIFRMVVTLLACTTWLMASQVVLAEDNGPTVVPDGYTGYLVFMANGQTPLDETINFVTDAFFTNVMGWSQAELDDFLAAELAHIAMRFGIAEPVTNPDVAVLTVQTNPAINYRAYTISGRNVPPQGFPVREGAMLLVVTNPDGLTLGGEFEGVHIPVNSAIASGFYNLQILGETGELTGEELIIAFRSAEPIPPIGALEQFSFFCEVESDAFGAGLAQGINNAKVIGEGEDQVIHSNVRTVITFSELGGL